MESKINKFMGFFDRYKIVFVSSVQTILWGVWVINPYYTIFSSSEMFSVLSKIGSEIIWGHFAIFIGLSKLLSSYFTLKTYNYIKIIPFVLGIFLWSTISVSYFSGRPNNIDLSSVIGFLLVDVLCLESEIRRYYENKKDGG